MTISSTARKAGPFSGNGVTTAFPFGFKVFAKGDVKLIRVDANGGDTTLTLDSDYSILLNADQNNSPGGTITYPISGTPLQAGYQLVCLGDLPLDQKTNITNSGGFYPSVIEDMVDRTTIQIQQTAETVSRAIVVSEAENTSPVLPPAAARANTMLGFDAVGNVELMPLPASIGAGDLRNEKWTAGVDFIAGTSTSVQLSRAYGSKANLGSVVMQGGAQDPDSYQLVGTTLTFLDDSGNPTPIPFGIGKIWCTGGTTLSIYVPPDGSVTAAKLAAGAVTDLVVDPGAAIQSSKLSYTAPVDGAPAQPVNQRLSQTLYASDFCALDGVTNDAAGLQALVNTGKRIVIPYTTQGIRLDSPVTIGTGQIIEFENPSMVVKSISASCVFRMTGYGDGSKLTSGMRGGCTFDMTGAPSTSTAIRFGTTEQNVWGVRISDGRYSFLNCYEAIGDEQTVDHYTVDCRFDDCYFRYTKGRQIYSRRSRGFFIFENIYIDQQANAVPPTWEGARFEDSGGIEFVRFDCATSGLGSAAYQSTAIALVINGTGQSGFPNSYARVKRLLVDNTFGNGFLINNCTNVLIDDICLYQNLGWGAQFIGCTEITVNNAQCHGAVNVAGASAGQHGLEFDSCDGVQLNNIKSDFNTGNGILLNNTTRSVMTNWRTKFNGNIGYVESGTSDINANSFGVSYGNTHGAISIVGAASYTDAFRPDSGAVTANHTGGLAL